MERQAISVSELNEYIRERFDADVLLKNVVLRGEISNYRPNLSGHLYFSMKDEKSAIRCVMFRSSAYKLKFGVENGMKVVAVGNVSVFTRDGQYQLYVSELVPDGVGELYVAFEQLKARLAAEGLFAREHKKPLPRFPKKIAIVTSPTGAAIRDMLRVLKKRYPLAKVLVVPAKVQGEGAAGEITAGIKLVNDKNAADLIITGRGGGSLEDLWCFNEEIVARAIYASRIPVISAVGHEPDVTISDFAADLRAATPSNAAELAVPDSVELMARLDETGAALARRISSAISERKIKLEGIASKKALSSPLYMVDEKRLMLDYLTRQLTAACVNLTAVKARAFAAAAAALDAMSPLKVLGRGYSIATDAAGKAVTDAQTLKPGDKIKLRLHRGGADCEILETHA